MNTKKVIADLDKLLTDAARQKPATQKMANFYGAIKKGAQTLDINFRPATDYPYTQIKEGGEVSEEVLNKVRNKKKIKLMGAQAANLEVKKEESKEKKKVVSTYSLAQMKKYVELNIAISKQLAIDEGAVKAKEVNALNEDALAEALFNFYQIKNKADAS